MKKAKILLLFFTFLSVVQAQSRVDFGAFAGTSHYLGDINKERLFYAPSFAAGAFSRFILNPRYAIRASVTRTPVYGNDLDFPNNFQQTRGESFRAMITDIGFQFEFNFLKYKYSVMKRVFSPYVSAGTGIAMVSDRTGYSTNLIIPFGAGVKVFITKRMSCAVLWEFRKTFTDDLDRVSPVLGSEFTSKLHNYDWYYIFGVNFSYRINYYKNLCPAYD